MSFAPGRADWPSASATPAAGNACVQRGPHAPKRCSRARACHGLPPSQAAARRPTRSEQPPRCLSTSRAPLSACTGALVLLRGARGAALFDEPAAGQLRLEHVTAQYFSAFRRFLLPPSAGCCACCYALPPAGCARRSHTLLAPSCRSPSPCFCAPLVVVLPSVVVPAATFGPRRGNALHLLLCTPLDHATPRVFMPQPLLGQEGGRVPPAARNGHRPGRQVGWSRNN